MTGQAGAVLPHVLKVLLVEDDDEVAKSLLKRLNPYEGQLSCVRARDAGQASEFVRHALDEGSPFDALILDVMLPYASAGEELKSATDPDEVETGIRWLKSLSERWKPRWTAVVTGRANEGALREARALLGVDGALYTKPFDDLRFEHELVTALGLESKVPEVYRPAKA